MISSAPRRASAASLRSKPWVSEINPTLFTAFAMACEVPFIANVGRVLAESLPSLAFFLVVAQLAAPFLPCLFLLASSALSRHDSSLHPVPVIATNFGHILSESCHESNLFQEAG